FRAHKIVYIFTSRELPCVSFHLRYFAFILYRATLAFDILGAAIFRLLSREVLVSFDLPPGPRNNKGHLRLPTSLGEAEYDVDAAFYRPPILFSRTPEGTRLLPFQGRLRDLAPFQLAGHIFIEILIPLRGSEPIRF